MPFSNGLLQGRSMRTERMLHVSEEGEAAVVRIQSTQMVAVGGKRSLLGPSPRGWDSTKRRPPFDWIMECMWLEGVVVNWVICEEHPATCDVCGVSSASAFVLALRVLCQMGWTTPR